MPVFHIHNDGDPRIAVFQNLKDKQLALDHGLFVVEGEFLVRRLLASRYAPHAVLMTPARYQSGLWDVPEHVPLFLASTEIISHIVGFDFHRGVLALGLRGEQHQLWHYADINIIDRLVVCPEINDVENLGSIMRTAAGLGYEHFLLGESCCDPFSRRAIRTSMGAVFKLQLFRTTNLIDDLKRLKSECGFEWHATVLDDEADDIKQVKRPPKLGLILGSEAHGLPEAILQLSDVRVTIPMALGTDSLNVSVAAGIFMAHYRL